MSAWLVKVTDKVTETVDTFMVWWRQLLKVAIPFGLYMLGAGFVAMFSPLCDPYRQQWPALLAAGIGYVLFRVAWKLLSR